MKTVSFVYSFRNRSIPQFKNCLSSLDWQTIKPTEVIVTDMSTVKSEEITQLCKDFNVNYTYLKVEGEEHWVDLNVFYRCHNISLRKATSDLIFWTGTDLIYHRTLIEKSLELINLDFNLFLTCQTKRLNYTPDPPLNHDKLFHKMSKWENFWEGAVLGATRQWWRKVRGFDQRIKWGLDQDIMKRAEIDGLKLTNIGVQTVHQPHRDFRENRRKDFIDIVKNREWIIERDKTVIRNNANWGLWKT